MQKISIRAVSSLLQPATLEQINERHETLVKTISIDFADTGFFLKTGFDKLEVIQDLSHENKYRIDFVEDPQLLVLKTISVIPVADFDHDDHFLGFKFCQLEAVKTLVFILDHFNLESRSFKVRAFHVQAEISRTKIEKTLEPVDEPDTKTLEIHVELLEESPFWEAQLDFLSFEFIEKIESILVNESLGEIEGNIVGQGYFTLYCVGENPRLMLNRVKSYLKTCINGANDFVVIMDDSGKEKIPILSHD
jgi:hypothetical protein